MQQTTPEQLEAMQLYGAEDVDELEAVLRALDAWERKREE